MLKIFPSAVSRVIFIALCILCVTPFVEAPLALAAGFLCTLLLGNPYKKFTAKIIQRLLKYSVVGLGFGMNIHEALKAGSEGLRSLCF